MDKKAILISPFLLLMILLVVSTLYTDTYSLESSEKDLKVNEETKTVLIVLDGGDWEPINQLIEKDELPNLQRMKDEGVYGEFKTPSGMQHQAWTRIGSGVEDVNPNSWNVETDEGNRRMTDSRDVENKRIWDYLGEAGIKSGVTNFFLTWPVESINGYMVSESMATSNVNLQHPSGFLDDDVVKEGSEWDIAHEALEESEDARFMTFGFKAVDAKQHALWRFIVPEKFGEERKEEHEQYRDEVYDEYRELDSFISEIGEEWNILVVSSFGFTEEGDYQASSLEEFHEGQSPAGYVYPTYEGDMDPILRELGYIDYETVMREGDEVKDVSESQITDCPIDYPDPTYLNETAFLFNMCVQDESLNLEKVVDELEQISYRGGRSLFESVEYSEEDNRVSGKWRFYEDQVAEKKVEPSYTHQPFATFKGYEVDKAIDLEMSDGTSYRYWIGPERSGTHVQDSEGIFLAQGPDIADRGEMPLGTFGVTDIAPTVLYMYDLPIPEAMDGRPLTELFKEDFAKDRSVKMTRSGTGKQETYHLEDYDKHQQKNITVNSTSDWYSGKTQPGTTRIDNRLSLSPEVTGVDYWESNSIQLDWTGIEVRTDIPEESSSEIKSSIIYSDNPEFEDENGEYHILGSKELDLGHGKNSFDLEDYDFPEDVYYRVFFSLYKDDESSPSPSVLEFTIRGYRLENSSVFY